MTDVIEITHDDIFDNFHDVLEHNEVFQNTRRVEMINTFMFYVENQELMNYKRIRLPLRNEQLSKKELLTLVLNNNKTYHKKYNLVGIYKYNVDLNSSDLKEFCKNPEDARFDRLLESYNKIQSIKYDKVMEITEDYQYLILVFSEQIRRQEPQKDVDTQHGGQDKVASSQSQPVSHDQNSTIDVSSKKQNKTKKKVRFNSDMTTNTSNPDNTGNGVIDTTPSSRPKTIKKTT
jgi:hypothetical protein